LHDNYTHIINIANNCYAQNCLASVKFKCVNMVHRTKSFWHSCSGDYTRTRWRVPERNHAVKQSVTVHEGSRKAERFNVLRNLESSSKWLISIKQNK